MQHRMRLPPVRDARMIVPTAVRRAGRRAIEAVASVRRSAARRRLPRISSSQLVGQLRDTGIAAGDLIFVHSALSRIGNVDGGAQAVVAALVETVGKSGTLVMPAYRDADGYMAMLAAGKVLDLRTAGSETGAITEALRVTHGALRSSHPFASCVALGSLAELVIDSHHIDPRICHKDSPLGRLLDAGGKVVGLGTDVGTVTLYHCLEDMWQGTGINPYGAPFIGKYIDASGAEIVRTLLRHDPIVSRYRIDRPEGQWIRDTLRGYFDRIGLRRTFRFGTGPAWVMNASRLYSEMQYLAERGITIYSMPNAATVAAFETASSHHDTAGVL